MDRNENVIIQIFILFFVWFISDCCDSQYVHMFCACNCTGVLDCCDSPYVHMFCARNCIGGWGACASMLLENVIVTMGMS